MQNGDLKRFYPQHDYDKKDFVRLNANAKIPAELIDGGVGTKVVANPTLAGTEANLTGVQVGETKYKVEQPINVVANPVLAGTENALTGIEVGSTKYKVETGGTVGYTLTIKPTSYSPAQEQDMSKGYVLVLGTYNGAYGWHKIQLPNSKQFNDIIINNVSLFSCVFTNPEEYPCAHFNTTGAGTMSLIDCEGTMYNSDDWPNGFYFIDAGGKNNRKLFYLIQDISISMYND